LQHIGVDADARIATLNFDGGIVLVFGQLFYIDFDATATGEF
jgi:hypothetical protein